MKCNNKEVQRIVIAFVEDSDFCTSRVESERKIQEIFNFHETMHEATKGRAQKEKVTIFGWKLKNNEMV